MSIINNINSPPSSCEETVAITSVKAFGVSLDEQQTLLLALQEKVNKWIQSPAVQRLISQRGDPSKIKFSKKGLQILIGNKLYNVATFEELTNPSLLDQSKRNMPLWLSDEGQQAEANDELMQTLEQAERTAVLQANPQQQLMLMQKVQQATALVNQQIEQGKDGLANGPTTLARVAETMAVSVDALSMTANSSSVIQKGGLLSSAASVGAWITAISALRGFILIGSGGIVMYRRGKELLSALEIQDGEGAINAALFSTFGFFLSGVGASSAASNVAALSGAAATAAQAGLAVCGLGLLMEACLLTLATRGLVKACSFKNKLDAALKGEGKNNDAQKLAQGLEALQKKVTLSAVEISGDSIKDEKLLKKKWAQFSRCTNEGALKQLLEHQKDGDLDKWIADLQKGDDASMTKARSILATVYEANYRAKIRFCILIAIGIFSTAAFILGLIFTGGLANLLFACAAVIWLGVDSSALHKEIGDWFWKWRKHEVMPEVVNKGFVHLKNRPADQTEFWATLATGIVLAPVLAIPYILFLETLGKKKKEALCSV